MLIRDEQIKIAEENRIVEIKKLKRLLVIIANLEVYMEYLHIKIKRVFVFISVNRMT